MRCALPIFFAAAWSGCATTGLFSDRPILWRDPDDLPIALPKPHTAGIQWTGMRDAVVLPAERALSLDYGEESWNVNALDETPDSTWYVDIRRSDGGQAPPRAFTVEEMTRGPFGDDRGPVLPLTITKGKAEGSTPGLVALDARGKRYMLKLDPPGWLGLNTSTEVVATRLAWAAGWLVPSEKIIDVKPADLILSPKARTKDRWDMEVPLTAEMVAALLERTPHEADGTIRICASRWLEGKNVGWWAYTGRRPDDPNDRIPHEDRRDVRGFGVFAAWVNDIDAMENNTMDAYVGPEGKGHLIHYQQDVGGSFGQFAAVPATVWMGDETYFMPGRILASLFTFGGLYRTWEGDAREERRAELLRDFPQLGYFDDLGFDPAKWHPILDNPAFVRQTARDRYWGAKRVIAFSEVEIRAAVALGHYPPATAERLVEILLHRRTNIARAFLAEVAPLDYFHFEQGRLCFSDLWLDAGLGGERYSAAIDGLPKTVGSDRCLDAPLTAGYHIARLSATPVAARRRHVPLVGVHFVADGRSAHVVGIER